MAMAGLYPFLGVIYFKKQLNEVNVEKNNKGEILGKKIFITCQNMFQYTIMYVLGPWIMKLRFAHRYMFASMGF